MTAAPRRDGAVDALLARLFTFNGVLGCYEPSLDSSVKALGPPSERFAARDADLLAAARAEVEEMRKRIADLELIVRTANRCSGGVAIDKGAFTLTRWTFQNKLFLRGSGGTAGIRLEPFASVNFEEDDCTPKLDDEMRAALGAEAPNKGKAPMLPG